jgi:alkylated DNA repair dioxygenase AlkB
LLTLIHNAGGEVPRLVAVQGEVSEDGSIPIYRHPSDSSPPLHPFTPTISLIRTHVQEKLKHPVNHVLIQYYRSGGDYISEHSDKTVDVVRDSNIVNVSLGAQRTMILRKKKDAVGAGEDDDDGRGQSNTSTGPPTKRPAQRISLPHNSMLVMGLSTNQQFLHSIKRDLRRDIEKSPSELANDTKRISLTFRHIGTFLTEDGTKIYGQGARAKTRTEARDVILPGEGEEGDKLLEMFGRENKESDFDWETCYGGGFDVVNFRTVV